MLRAFLILWSNNERNDVITVFKPINICPDCGSEIRISPKLNEIFCSECKYFISSRDHKLTEDDIRFSQILERLPIERVLIPSRIITPTRFIYELKGSQVDYEPPLDSLEFAITPILNTNFYEKLELILRNALPSVENEENSDEHDILR